VETTAVLDVEVDCIMCFTDPGQVTAIDGSIAQVQTVDGASEVSLRLIEAAGRQVCVGDWVLVSLGLVVDVVDAAAGQMIFDEMSALRGQGDR
jgi:hydrogenase assembly chaperone HypC/HupF